MSHVAYATGSKANDVGPTGTCPASHPVVIPQVMYEVMWDVSMTIYSWLAFVLRGPAGFVLDSVNFTEKMS
jgi:hypothetical protein